MNTVSKPGSFTVNAYLSAPCGRNSPVWASMVAPPHDSCAAANASIFDRVEVVVEPGDRRRVGGHDVELFLADRGEDLELFGRHRAGVTAFAVGGGDRFEASSGADVGDGRAGRRRDVPLGGEAASSSRHGFANRPGAPVADGELLGVVGRWVLRVEMQQRRDDRLDLGEPRPFLNGQTDRFVGRVAVPLDVDIPPVPSRPPSPSSHRPRAIRSRRCSRSV